MSTVNRAMRCEIIPGNAGSFVHGSSGTHMLSSNNHFSSEHEDVAWPTRDFPGGRATQNIERVDPGRKQLPWIRNRGDAGARHRFGLIEIG
jgi:hypothetical protein